MVEQKIIDELLTRGTVDVIVRDDLEKKLKSGKKLRVKLGIDPTGSRLHIGRGVVLRKLRKFQDAGHQIVLIIGDFTGIVGDASDKDCERPRLTLEKVKENMKTYLPQIGRILNVEKCEIRYNSEWLGKLNFAEIADLAQEFSVAEMLDRDNFSKRFKSGKRISLHEFLYPLMQGQDSVAVKSDLEIGGTDQLFNLLAGRTLQKSAEQVPQNVLTLKLIEGTDGRKMSTSWGNTIFLDEPPNEMFGKIMSIPDELMEKYFEVLTDENLAEMKKLISKNPRDAKVKLGKSIVAWLHGGKEADAAEQDFVQKFVKKEVPDEMCKISVGKSEIGILELLAKICKFCGSNSDARRLVQQGAVSIDGEKVVDPNFIVKISGEKILKSGKRNWAKIVR
ncbi:tyrosine--tRNA ligase [bacterium]|jgi:tyrosyl-tRNA synthetase|nr:tyrosine--tRNA ligase [bacterium]MBT6831516.1 tyrosine--tRNA ligase [bacterium]MBT6996166.1 tyrosine--tRNA ligase [bacterium]MBT7772549.1 tyrosine--tRNA ligase [bacterium]